MATSYYDYIGRSLIYKARDEMPGFLKKKLKHLDVVENEDEPGIVYLLLYAHDIHFMSDYEAERLAEWLKKLLDDLNKSLSIGKYTYAITAEEPK